MSTRWPNAGLTVQADSRSTAKARWFIVLEDTGDALNRRGMTLVQACRDADKLEREITSDMRRLGMDVVEREV